MGIDFTGITKEPIYDAGEPETVLTPVNIRSVYGVEAEVVNRGGGRPYIVPIRSV